MELAKIRGFVFHNDLRIVVYLMRFRLMPYGMARGTKTKLALSCMLLDIAIMFQGNDIHDSDF